MLVVGAIRNVGHAVKSEVERSVRISIPGVSLAMELSFHLDLEIGHGAAAPNNSDQGDIMLTTVEHNLFDETPQQRLALGIRCGRVSPDLWETTGQADDLAMQGLGHPHVSDGLGRRLLGERLLCRPDFIQSRFPAPLEFRSNETVVGIDPVDLPFG